MHGVETRCYSGFWVSGRWGVVGEEKQVLGALGVLSFPT